MIEIERKFLVKDYSFENEAVTIRAIKQGFLSTDPNRTVRIRVEETGGFITVKGISTDGGVSRFEWENPLSKEAAEALFKLCLPGKIEKTRHVVSVGSHHFEVDVFYGDNQGLVIAEVELSDSKQEFEKPAWLGKEVTGDQKYYNASLSQHPFKDWK
ncbi:CYTH domain-containing protein [Flavobacteriaceae bacterium]|nr:CYTH domain-containing protein [Flavobacteriaceae bacterium]